MPELSREDKMEPEMDCLHCDSPFPPSYLIWHFSRRDKKQASMLRCKECGLTTPVRWQVEAA